MNALANVVAALTGGNPGPAPAARSPSEQIVAIASGASQDRIDRASRRRWRKRSLFGDCAGEALSVDQRRVWMAGVKRWCREGGMAEAAAERVAEVLLRCHGETGRCFPSYAYLARAAGCSVRTVGRALARLRDAGWISWARRLIRDGWQARQTSNSYTLAIPSRAPRHDGHDGRGRRKKESQSLTVVKQVASTAAQQIAVGWSGSVEAALAALRRRREQVERTLRNGMKIATETDTT